MENNERLTAEAPEPIIRTIMARGVLSVDLLWCEPKLDTQYEYAFYLKDGDERVQTVWYQASPSAEFVLKERGVYHIIAFWRNKLSRIVASRASEQFYAFSSIPEKVRLEHANYSCVDISIWGSCVSRDALEYASKEHPPFRLKSYIARQSVVSAVSKPIACSKEVQLDSGFQKRMVQCDLDKSGLEKLRSDGSRFLIIDLIDERFDLVAVGESFATLSNESVASGIWDENFTRIKKQQYRGGYRIANQDIAPFIDHFAQRIRDIYGEEHIILHSARMSDYYMDRAGRIRRFPRNHLVNNARINTLLEYMENRLKQNLPGMKAVDISKGFCADEQHKWGLSPMHYQKEYYEQVLSKIVLLTEVNENV